MKVQIEPTPETHEFTINGVKVPTRVWTGTTDKGTSVALFVLSIVPSVTEDQDQLGREIPEFMLPSRKVFKIGKKKNGGYHA